ncbi:MAG: ABC transporter substrate-binding protein [Halioglobus sp.]|jgi:ABC-type branched-subunit amino acid transport system substrate-binding protein|nr:ABC transporter substrate-binding protein [Halioglobus sp.]
MKKNKFEPHKIGVMVDMPGFPGATDTFPKAVQFALDEAYDRGLLDRPAVTVLNEHLGQPWGDGYASRNAYLDLVETEQVLAIAGPFTTDNSLAILDLVEEKHVPSITICGTQEYVGKYAFNTSNGNLADEPAYIAAWLKSRGHKRVSVVRDYPSIIGREYHKFFEYACQQFGIEIVGVGNIYPGPTEEDVTHVMKALKATNPDALVYLGFGEACRELNNGLRNADWSPERIMTTAFCQATYNEFFAQLIDGWYGVDQYDERNHRLSSMIKRYEEKHGEALIANSCVSAGYDIGQCIAIALSRMEIATPESLASALETIRMLPATTGGVGTYITFGPHDHRGLKGIDYLNIRRAEGGKTHRVDFEFGGSPA